MDKKPTSLFNRGSIPSNLLRPAKDKAERPLDMEPLAPPPVVSVPAEETSLPSTAPVAPPAPVPASDQEVSPVADSDASDTSGAGEKPARALFTKKPRKPAEVEEAKPKQEAVSEMPLPMVKNDDLDKESVEALHAIEQEELTGKAASAKSKKSVNFGSYVEKAVSLFKASSFLKPKSLVLMTELSSLGTVAFHITEDTIQEVTLDSAPALLSFTPDDMRYHSETPLKASEVDSLVLSELGVRAYHLTKQISDTMVVYASPAARIESYSQAVCPGLSILEEALASKMADVNKDYVIGTYLTDESGKSLLILYYKNKISQRFTKVSVAANATDISFVLKQFCAAVGVTTEECEIYLLDNRQLLSAVKAHWLAYPHEDEIYGLSVRKLSLAGVSVVGLLSLCSVGYAGYLYATLYSLKDEETRITQQISSEKQNINTLLSSSVTSFAKTQQLDVATVFKRAEQFWLPTSVISMDSTLDTEVYRIQVMMVKQKLPVVNSPYQQLLMMKAPEGCMKDSISYLGAMNGVQVTVKCQNPISPLSGYRIG